MEHLLCIRQDCTYSTLFARTTHGLDATVIPIVTDKETEGTDVPQSSHGHTAFHGGPGILSHTTEPELWASCEHLQKACDRAIMYTFIFFIIDKYIIFSEIITILFYPILNNINIILRFHKVEIYRKRAQNFF